MRNTYYHNPVIKLNPGLMTLSNVPSRKRRTMRLAKLEAAPWQARTIAQQNIVPAKYLAMGNLTNPREPGRLAARYPK